MLIIQAVSAQLDTNGREIHRLLTLVSEAEGRETNLKEERDGLIIALEELRKSFCEQILHGDQLRAAIGDWLVVEQGLRANLDERFRREGKLERAMIRASPPGIGCFCM